MLANPVPKDHTREEWYLPPTHTHSLRLNEWSPILSSRMPDCTPCLSHWGGKERWSHVLTSAIRSSRWTGWRFVIWEVGQGLHPTLYSYFMFLRNVCFLLLPTCVENNQAQLQYIDIYFNWLVMLFLKPIWNTFCSCTFFVFLPLNVVERWLILGQCLLLHTFLFFLFSFCKLQIPPHKFPRGSIEHFGDCIAMPINVYALSLFNLTSHKK